MTETIKAPDASTAAADRPSIDPALRARHRAMWAMGDYPAVASEIIASLGPILVEFAQIQPGERVLDVAAGSGNAAIPAALAGAHVVASDLTPELLETGRAAAGRVGADLEWVEGDAQALPFADESFDAVLSCVGVMFAPFHQLSADELVRVSRAGGRIALLSWTPEGFIGQMFKVMRPYAPPPPAGAQPPPLWGDANHLRDLFGDGVADIETEVRSLRVDLFESGEEFRDYFKRNYGPTIAAYRSLADDPQRAQALDQELAELGRRFGLTGRGSSMEWEYLLFRARRG